MGKSVAQTKRNQECKEHFEYKICFSSASSLWLCSFLVLQDIRVCVRPRASRDGDKTVTTWLAHVQVCDTDYHDTVVAYEVTAYDPPLSLNKLWTREGFGRVEVTRTVLNLGLPEERNSDPVLSQFGIWASCHLLSWPQSQINRILKMFTCIC